MTDEEMFAEFHRHWRYNPETGNLHHLISRGRSKAGAVVGHRNQLGYWYTCFKGKHLLVHRIIWAMHHGRWPKAEIDHIDCDPSNNRLENLREATHAQNASNRKPYAAVAKGVHPTSCGFKAHITVNGKHYHIGHFKTVEQASAAYAARAVEAFGEFARTA